MKREQTEVIISALWPSGNQEKGKGRWGEEYYGHQTKVTTASRGENI